MIARVFRGAVRDRARVYVLVRGLQYIWFLGIRPRGRSGCICSSKSQWVEAGVTPPPYLLVEVAVEDDSLDLLLDQGPIRNGVALCQR